MRIVVVLLFIFGSLKSYAMEFKHEAYGVMLWRQYETFKSANNLKPYNREQIDLSELALIGEYEISPSSSLEWELEIEHGGVGTAIEFEPFEEFGEFEQEVEQGGEVALHEFYYEKKTEQDFYFKVGKFPLKMSLSSTYSHPKSTPRVEVSALEARMLPVDWTETGIQLGADRGSWHFSYSLVNGLNSEFFRKYNWIGGGHQRHFESVNAADKASVLSVSYGESADPLFAKISYYRGDSSNNRWKKDKLTVNAEVEITSLQLSTRHSDFQIVGQYLKGKLQNAEEVVLANATLGGLAKPKAFAALGSEAKLQSLMAIYHSSEQLQFALGIEHVNTFEKVEGSIFADPRYEVTAKHMGFSWEFDSDVYWKTEFIREKTELSGLPEVSRIYTALTFDFEV